MDEKSIQPQISNKKLDLHKVFAAVGIILIVMIIIGGGMWYMVQSAEDKVPVNDDVTVTKVASDSAKTKTATDSVQKSGWKTYTNKSLGFSIDYPDSKFCSKGKIIERTLDLAVKEAKNEVVFKAFDCLSDFSLVISIVNNAYAEPTDKFGSFTFVKEKSLTIDSIQTKIKTFGADPGNILIVYLKKGDVVYLFQYAGSMISQVKQGDEITTLEFEEMLSTFKFLD